MDSGKEVRFSFTEFMRMHKLTAICYSNPNRTYTISGTVDGYTSRILTNGEVIHSLETELFDEDDWDYEDEEDEEDDDLNDFEDKPKNFGCTPIGIKKELTIGFATWVIYEEKVYNKNESHYSRLLVTLEDPETLTLPKP